MKEWSRRISWLLGGALCVGLLVAACDLNPQPLPPGVTDGNGSQTSRDAGATAADDAGFGGGAGTDAAAEGAEAPPTGGDAATPVSDASTDAATDAAVDGGATDGSTDAAGDGATDAGDAGQGDE